MSNDLFNLQHKIALVTGASRGIGKAIATLLAEHGAHVIISSRKLDDCQKVVDTLTTSGYSAEAIACNIGDKEQLLELFASIAKRHGKLDILVNNAATNPYFGHILDTDWRAFEKTVAVNIQGYFFACIEAGKLMREHGGGNIINIASVNALQPGLAQGIYSITKAAVVNMTRAFAKECAALDIRVNAVLPGLTKTDFAGALFEDDTLYQQIVATIPMQRHAAADEIAGTVLYLASSASSYTTGECIVVDGGLTL